jgi:teichuronic acid biosynthesis glycosyltransferase TuaH
VNVTGDWDGLVVLVAGSSYRNAYGLQYASHHVAHALTRYAPVLYVDPLSAPTAIARRYGGNALTAPRLRVVQQRLAVLSGVGLPGSVAHRMEPVSVALAQRSVRRAVHRLGGRVRAVVLFSTAHTMFDAVDADLRVYYAKDDFSAAADLLGGSAARASEREEQAAAKADIVVAHSPALMERWRAHEPVYVPNGVETDLFATSGTAPAPADITLSRPIVTFAGHLSKRVDIDLLYALAVRGHSLLLVGPRQPTFDPTTIDDLVARSNVEWLPGRAYEQLPAYFGASDVGIVPYTASRFNQASFPLKILEYLAAGLPVVTTDLPASRWLATDLVRIGSTAETFVAHVEAAIEEGVGEEKVCERRELARQHDWSERAATLARVLGLPAG